MPVSERKSDLLKAGVVMVRPNRIEVRGESIVVGRVGFGLLAALERGKASARQVKVRLWGDPDAPDNRLYVTVFNLNAKLESAGVKVRVSVEAGDVLLV